jgi:pilus assembly protein FimV
MRAVSTLTAIGAALWFAATSAHALGFGRVSNATQLGQPLNFAAAVRLEADESLPRECVFAEVFSGENRLQPGQIHVTLEGAADAQERSVRVTSTAVIDEPVVNVTVTLGCTAKVSRKFVAFIDPPLGALPQVASAESLPPQRVDSQVSPIVTMVEGEKPVRTAPRPAERPPTTSAPVRARPVTVTSQSGSAENQVPADPTPRKRKSVSKSPAVSTRPSTVAAAPAGPRLQLEAAPAVVARGASAPTPSPTAAATAVAAAEPASAPQLDDAIDQLAKERQRIQLLEEGLATLRRDSQATQNSLATLQARLKEAESERYANPLVYGLAWLVALLLLAVAALWWRLTRMRRAAQWWAAPPEAPAAGHAVADEVAQSAPQPLGGPASTAADAFNVSPVSVMGEDDAVASVPVARPSSLVAAAAPAAPEPPRGSSVEELIDLEQQAEFFIVLGQDEAAIELLMSHVRSDGGISPLPYLKLLEIYRRRGDVDAYERIRDRFNRRFNAYAPDWDSDLQRGRALEDYPDTIARLQALWSSPARAMETLDASLFRRNKSDETFELPAYREVLFLYSIARDLAEHGGGVAADNVDLLLPLSDDAVEEPITRLMATVPPGDFQSSDLMTMPLDLDVSFAGGGSPGSATASRDADARPEKVSNLIDFDLSLPPEPPPPDPTGTR